MTNSKTIIIATVFKHILNYTLLPVLLLFICCNTQNKHENITSITEDTTAPTETADINISGAKTATEVVNSIRSIFQDNKGNYWFGTQNLLGVCRYDLSAAIAGGKSFTWFTEKDGLCNNQVRTIQQDKEGNMWFNTGHGVSRFDGRTFTTFAIKDQTGTRSAKDWKIEPDDLWFDGGGGGVFRYNGNTFTSLQLPKADFDSSHSQKPSNGLTAYGVYCTLKDKKGNIWFGTQAMGVCRYNGKSFTWFTEKGLAGPAVRGLLEDKNGNLWFGNNGAGLFRYDPVSDVLTNFTQEKGLGNDEFLKTANVSFDKPGTLARVTSIIEDNNGNLWIGTFDAGAWRYDASLNDGIGQGKNLINYTTKDGLGSNAVYTIYKDKNGELWFGTDAGVSTFNGISFTTFVIK